MPKLILDVGQCDYDHSTICRLIASNFDAVVQQAHGQPDALAALREKSFNLVLVNRRLDRDGSDGVEIIHQIKADPALSSTPCMLVSNYPGHQEAAVGAGALPGFGKAELNRPETLNHLKQALDD